MRSAIMGAATVILAASCCVALAQTASDKPISAVPPAGRSANAATTNTGITANRKAPTPSTSGGPSSTVVPGSADSAGTANVGNSSENNGMPGSQGAGASATMQSGHASSK
jgi:hypothetical protein